MRAASEKHANTAAVATAAMNTMLQHTNVRAKHNSIIRVRGIVYWRLTKWTPIILEHIYEKQKATHAVTGIAKDGAVMSQISVVT